jgi:hypothetical protein
MVRFSSYGEGGSGFIQWCLLGLCTQERDGPTVAFRRCRRMWLGLNSCDKACIVVTLSAMRSEVGVFCAFQRFAVRRGMCALALQPPGIVNGSFIPLSQIIKCSLVIVTPCHTDAS